MVPLIFIWFNMDSFYLNVHTVYLNIFSYEPMN